MNTIVVPDGQQFLWLSSVLSTSPLTRLYSREWAPTQEFTMHADSAAAHAQQLGHASLASVKVDPIAGALNDIAVSMNRAEGLVNDLRARLGSVLRPEPPNKTSPAPEALNATCPLHGELSSLGNQAFALNESIDAILARLVL